MSDVQILLLCPGCGRAAESIAEIVLHVEDDMELECPNCKKPSFSLFVEQSSRTPIRTAKDLRREVEKFIPIGGEEWH